MTTSMRFLNCVVLILLALALAWIFCGCAMVSGARTAPDGSVIRIQSVRFFWHSVDVDFTVTTPEGINATLKVGSSRSDPESIHATGDLAEKVARGTAEGFAKGVSKGVLPVP